MELRLLFTVATLTVATVARAQSVAPAKISEPSSSIESGNIDAGIFKKRIVDLLSQRKEGGGLKPEAIAQLIALIPKLETSGFFWEAIGAIPEPQNLLFRDSIASSLKLLAPKAEQADWWSFRNAYNIAKRLRDPEIARIALDQLSMVPDYRFRDKPMPDGWPGVEATEDLLHGEQGLLSSTIVECGDERTLALFRDKLKYAPPNLQRVMIWALGRSAELVDFDFLMTLRTKDSGEGTSDTLVRALNRIPLNMERVVEYPGTASPGRPPKDPKKLIQTASECKERLSQERLVVELSMYD